MEVRTMTDEIIREAISLLTQIKEDRFAPRNVRNMAEEAINILKEDGDLDINIDKVIQMLDEISNDPNIDMAIRTMIWNVVSVLESR